MNVPSVEDPQVPVMVVDRIFPGISGTPSFVRHFLYPGHQAGQIVGTFQPQYENGIEGAYASNYAYTAAINAPYITSPQAFHNNLTQATPANVKGTLARAQLYARIAPIQNTLPGAP